MTLMLGLILMVLSSLLAAIGHICFKKVAIIETSLSKKLLHPLFFLGGFLFLCNPLIATMVAKVLDFSIMFAMTSLTFVFVVFFSWLVLNEKLDLPKIMGMCIIVTGLWLMLNS